MSTLSSAEKQYLETILDMSAGYVLDFNDRTFAEFFRQYSIAIHGNRYRRNGTSKAKKMRAFWDLEPDSVVGPVLNEMIDKCEAQCQLGQRQLAPGVLARGKHIASRLTGLQVSPDPMTAQGFLDVDLQLPDLKSLPIAPTVSDVIHNRLDEAALCLKSGAHMAVVFLCGSILEAVLLGAASHDPGRFNQSVRAPKSVSGKVKQFHDWKLSELIDVASEVGLLKPDVQKFSHGVRDFRNYIHPYQQINSGFLPDDHTARLCFQALKAALADVAGER